MEDYGNYNEINNNNNWNNSWDHPVQNHQSSMFEQNQQSQFVFNESAPSLDRQPRGDQSSGFEAKQIVELAGQGGRPTISEIRVTAIEGQLVDHVRGAAGRTLQLLQEEHQETITRENQNHKTDQWGISQKFSSKAQYAQDEHEKKAYIESGAVQVEIANKAHEQRLNALQEQYEVGKGQVAKFETSVIEGLSLAKEGVNPREALDKANAELDAARTTNAQLRNELASEKTKAKAELKKEKVDGEAKLRAAEAKASRNQKLMGAAMGVMFIGLLVMGALLAKAHGVDLHNLSPQQLDALKIGAVAIGALGATAVGGCAAYKAIKWGREHVKFA